MNVERIQKINNLALDLMKQGLANNREEAISQAEKIFSGEEVNEYNSIKETMKEVKTETKSEINNSDDEEKNPIVGHDLHPEKVKEILHQNTTFLVQKIKEFQEKVSSLEREMASLKNEFRFKQLPTVNEIMTVKEQQTVQQTVSQERKEAPNHPRSGNFKDTDVSIEKFFYMGSK